MNSLNLISILFFLHTVINYSLYSNIITYPEIEIGIKDINNTYYLYNDSLIKTEDESLPNKLTLKYIIKDSANCNKYNINELMIHNCSFSIRNKIRKIEEFSVINIYYLNNSESIIDFISNEKDMILSPNDVNITFQNCKNIKCSDNNQNIYYGNYYFKIITDIENLTIFKLFIVKRNKHNMIEYFSELTKMIVKQDDSYLIKMDFPDIFDFYFIFDNPINNEKIILVRKNILPEVNSLDIYNKNISILIIWIVVIASIFLITICLILFRSVIYKFNKVK